MRRQRRPLASPQQQTNSTGPGDSRLRRANSVVVLLDDWKRSQGATVSEDREANRSSKLTLLGLLGGCVKQPGSVNDGASRGTAAMGRRTMVLGLLAVEEVESLRLEELRVEFQFRHLRLSSGAPDNRTLSISAPAMPVEDRGVSCRDGGVRTRTSVQETTDRRSTLSLLRARPFGKTLSATLYTHGGKEWEGPTGFPS